MRYVQFERVYCLEFPKGALEWFIGAVFAPFFRRVDARPLVPGST